MTDVKVRGASVEVRSIKLTRSLLKQFRRLRSLSEPFRLAADGETTTVRLNPEYTVGWFSGTVLDEKYGAFVLFIKDGDGFLYHWLGFKAEPWCKQLYI